MKESELIAEAQAQDSSITTVLEACEYFYMNGCPDEMSGDVESPVGHFYRVARWIVYTDSQGFHELQTCESELDARAHFDVVNQEYDAWCDKEAT